MNLGFGLRFEDLYTRDGLIRVDGAFLGFLDPSIRNLLAKARSDPPSARTESELLVALAPHVEDFLARLFGIETEAHALAARHDALAPLWAVKRTFVQRRALHKVAPESLKTFDPESFPFSSELEFARQVTEWPPEMTSAISASSSRYSSMNGG